MFGFINKLVSVLFVYIALELQEHLRETRRHLVGLVCPLQQEKLEGIANCNHLHLIFNKECFPSLNIYVTLLKGARIAT